MRKGWASRVASSRLGNGTFFGRPRCMMRTEDEMSGAWYKFSRNCRALIDSSFYRRVFPGTRLNPKKATEGEFETTRRGYRFTTSVGGTLTGRGGDVLIIDDAIKANDANSAVALGGGAKSPQSPSWVCIKLYATQSGSPPADTGRPLETPGMGQCAGELRSGSWPRSYRHHRPREDGKLYDGADLDKPGPITGRMRLWSSKHHCGRA